MEKKDRKRHWEKFPQITVWRRQKGRKHMQMSKSTPTSYFVWDCLISSKSDFKAWAPQEWETCPRWEQTVSFNT